MRAVVLRRVRTRAPLGFLVGVGVAVGPLAAGSSASTVTDRIEETALMPQVWMHAVGRQFGVTNART
jgi:hypothetical protein